MIDISIPLRPGAPEWPGDTPYACGWTARLADGATVNLSSITMSPHVGTHADAPLHVRDGWPASHELPLEAFQGPATVLDVSHVEGEIGPEHLEGAEIAGGRLILLTGRTIASGTFPDRWPTISEEVARTLVALECRLLAVDCPSVDERHSGTLPVHHILFEGGLFILENLDLRRVAPGDYVLNALPLRIMNLDAAPVRAVLSPARRVVSVAP